MTNVQDSRKKKANGPSSLMQRLWQATCTYFFIDRAHYPDRGRRAEAVVALSFMLVYSCAWFSYVPIYGILFQNKVAALAVGLIGLPTALGALFIQRTRKNLAVASALLNYGCALTLIGCIYATGGTWSPIYFWSFSPVAGAYLLSGSKHGMAVTAIAALGNAIVAFVTQPHLNPDQWFFQFDVFSSFHVGFIAMTVFFSLTVFSLILYIFETKLKQALHESEKARHEIEKQKQIVDEAFATIKEQMAENKAVMNATEVALVMIFPGMKIDLEKSSAYFQKLFPGIDNFSQVLRKMKIESAKSVLQSVIGESTLTWSLNESSFPLEAIIDDNTHELEWKKIENDGVITAIVFAAKNVQPLLDSKKKMESLNRYAQLLVTVVGEQDDNRSHDKEKKNRAIIKAINRQIPQVREAIARAEISLVDNWQPIYITLHTLKGEMSSFSFNDIKEFLHKTEEHVKDVREIIRVHQGKLDHEAREKLTAIKGRLIHDLIHIQNSLQEIQDICRQTGADQNAILISRERLQYAKDDPHLLKELVIDSLYEDVRDVIKGFESEIYKVAGDLGKPSPRLLISSGRYYLTDFAADKLRQALTHIIRNSLDHGIESRDERLQKGKSEIGELTFVVDDDGPSIQIRIRDDGRGLNLVDIREKAMAQGLIQQSRKHSLREISELILLPGFSTTRNVSMVSGRGIGMEAARGFIADLGGALTLHLLDQTDHPALELRLSIPKAHIPVTPDAWLESKSA
ncbi:MAG TPA: ATP-binding protein [Oligoflexus sp.]|uniref:ATP-binding protein n=1 Tax=Oligoflexus sp. TaxID=1971216 RepID=UPI002D7E969D|nr:ATP-binding protein [Oligoflexus sp.]HET9241060.1 ATP-binding protein [Oligoflexus sp.]